MLCLLLSDIYVDLMFFNPMVKPVMRLTSHVAMQTWHYYITLVIEIDTNLSCQYTPLLPTFGSWIFLDN